MKNRFSDNTLRMALKTDLRSNLIGNIKLSLKYKEPNLKFALSRIDYDRVEIKNRFIFKIDL